MSGLPQRKRLPKNPPNGSKSLKQNLQPSRKRNRTLLRNPPTRPSARRSHAVVPSAPLTDSRPPGRRQACTSLRAWQSVATGRRGAGGRGTSHERRGGAKGAWGEPAFGAAGERTVSLAKCGALRGDLDPRCPGSRSAPNLAQTRDMGVGFFGLASHWSRCTYDRASGGRRGGATRGSPGPRRRLVASSSRTGRQPLPSPQEQEMVS